MSTAAHADPYRIGGSEGLATGHGTGGPASKRVVVGFGFWIFLLSDVVMFSALFATYAVLARATADGPGAKEIFHRGPLAIQTAALLASSFCCGLASLAVERRSRLWTQAALSATALTGLVFVILEGLEFWQLIAAGDGPSRSAFLSAFFTLVGCHGLHVTLGGLWLATMMAQFFFKGFTQTVRHRFLCFSLFWHALDIIWVAIFSLVYLAGLTLP